MAQTPLEKLFEGIINIFHQYSVRVDHFDMISRGELKQLIEQQLTNFVKNKKKPELIEYVFAQFDKDKNQQLSFEECMGFFTLVAIAAHDNIHRKEGQGQGHGHSHEHGHGHSHEHGHGH